MSTGGVKSVRRGLGVLLALAEHGEPMTVTAVAEQLDQNRIQIARILQRLEQAQLIVRDPRTRAYRLSWQLYAQADEIALARLQREGPPVVRALAEATGEAAYVVVLRGDSSVAVLEEVPGISWVERAYPAFCDDGGQALLFDATRAELDVLFAATDFVPHGPNAPGDVDDFAARLEDTRERGYSVTDEEVEPGVLAVGAPVRDFSGQVVCALHIEGPREGLLDRTAEVGRSVVALAGVLSARLGWDAAAATATGD